MRRSRQLPLALALLSLLPVLMTPAVAFAQADQQRYEEALAREEQLRTLIETSGTDGTVRAHVLREAGQVLYAYRVFLHRHPTSAYSDNALFQSAELHSTLFDRYGREQDRTAAVTLYKRVGVEYPSSSLKRRAATQIAALETLAVDAAVKTSPAARPAAPSRAVTAGAPGQVPIGAEMPDEGASETPGRAQLTAIARHVLPEAVRVTITFDRETQFKEERAMSPSRLFFDFREVGVTPALRDAALAYPDDVVRHIRVGRHPNSQIRVVLDTEGVSRCSAFTLYNPYRVVVDCERPRRTLSASSSASAETRAKPPAPLVESAVALPQAATLPPASVPAMRPPTGAPDVVTANPLPAPVPSRDTASEVAPLPRPPAANTAGGFSLARQLGLGVSRIVIDPGHGGRDPGFRSASLSEAEVTLDIALRLEKLLQREPGIEVVLTRRTDAFVSLGERTAMANKVNADLFLSIHANASRNIAARGVETYFLSFASSPEAEAVAARENAGSEQAMHNLPEIVRAITLNNKLDESRDFAGMVQESLVSRLARVDGGVRSRGIKKAPFMVLIGAGMPSVLAEVSFLTNKDDGRLLKTSNYRQRIAEGLEQALLRYRRALKGQAAAAEKF